MTKIAEDSGALEKNIVTHEAVDPQKLNEATDDSQFIIADDDETAKQDTVSDKDPESNFEIVNDGPGVTEDVIYEGVDVEDYTDILGPSIFMPTGGVEELNRRRAELQSGWVQAGNMIGQAALGEIIGGTIEGLGYILDIGSMIDYIAGNETEWGNMITEAGKGIREYSQDVMPIYAENPGKFDPSDSGWWFSNGVSVASTLSMLIPSAAATKALGFLGKAASRGAGRISKTLDIAENMGKKATWMTEGISQAIVSRHIENSMEASGTFESALEDYKGRVNPSTGLPFTEEEARMLAAEAASSNYNKGWAMLLQDIPQYLALGKVFNPISGKMENALSAASKRGLASRMKPWQQKVGAFTGTFASEGFEESYQYYISEQGKALADLNAGLITREKYNTIMSEAIGSDEMMTSAFFGGLGGNLFQLAGRGVNQLSKGKKRRAYEKDYEKTYRANLNERAKSFMSMQVALADADQKGDPKQREAILDEMMLQMTVDALHRDKFDDHIEAIQGVTKMNKEELKQYAEKGIEMTPELAQKYATEAIQKAEDMRKEYLKFSNKYDSNIAASMARNNFDNKRITKHNAELASKQNEIIFGIPGQGRMSSNANNKAQGLIKAIALKTAKKEFQGLLKKANDIRKPHIESLIKDVDRKIKENEKFLEKDKLDDPRDAAKKREDARLAKGYDVVQDELIETMAMQELNDGRIFLNQQENLALKKKEYQDNVRKEITKENIRKNINTKEDVEEQREFILNQESWTEEEKKRELKFVADREVEIAEEQLYKNEAAKQKAVHGEQLKEVNEAAKNTRTITNRNVTPVKDNIEDEYGDDETNVDVFEQAKETTVSKKAKSGGNIKIPSYKGFASPGWIKWLFDGKDKTGKNGEPVMIDVLVGGANTEARKQAVLLYNKVKGGTSITVEQMEHIYNHLPLKVQLTEDIFSYIPAWTQNNTHFRTNEYGKRKAIIREMLRKGEIQLPVTHQFGGNLQVEETEDGTVPENNIMDLKHIDGKWGKVDLMVTNELGDLVKASDKSLHPDFEGLQIKVKGTTDDKGMPVPYKGGVFLNVPKANGDPFPLKLNLRRPTIEEAGFIADLLIAVVSNKEFKFGSRLSDNTDLYERLRDEHPAEFAVLGKDAKVGDVAKLFVHMSPDTVGKETHLHLDGGKGIGHFVSYGTDVNMMVNAKNAKQNREFLIGFIQNHKRRQINLKQWNDPKIGKRYREYVVGNILSTDAVVGQEKTLFYEEKTLGRNNGLPPFSYDLLLGVPDSDPVPVKKVPQKERNKVAKDIDIRENKSKEIGVFEEDQGQWLGVYVKPSGIREEVRGRSEGGVLALIKKKYDKERLSVTPEPAPVIKDTSDSTVDWEWYDSLTDMQRENPDFYQDKRFPSLEDRNTRAQNKMSDYEMAAEQGEQAVPNEEVADAIEKDGKYNENIANLDDPDILDIDDQGTFNCFGE